MIKVVQDTMRRPKLFAVLTVRFATRLTEEGLQEVQSLLRKVERVNSFSPGLRKVSFSIWAKDQIDYGVVAKLKKLLKKRQQKDPQIIAFEYVMKDRKSF